MLDLLIGLCKGTEGKWVTFLISGCSDGGVIVKNILRITLITLVLILLQIQFVFAEKPVVPKKIGGGTVIHLLDVKKLIDEGISVFDVRNKLDYRDGHIPGAVHLPYKEKSAKSVRFRMELDKFDLSGLPKEKETRIIFYCNGKRCWKSYKASTVAIKAGYQNVLWFRDGFPKWKDVGNRVEK